MKKTDLPNTLYIGRVSVGTSNIFIARQVAEIAGSITDADHGQITIGGNPVYWSRDARKARDDRNNKD